MLFFEYLSNLNILFEGKCVITEKFNWFILITWGFSNLYLKYVFNSDSIPSSGVNVPDVKITEIGNSINKLSKPKPELKQNKFNILLYLSLI